MNRKKGLYFYDSEYTNLIRFLISYYYAVELVRTHKTAKGAPRLPRGDFNSFQNLHFT